MDQNNNYMRSFIIVFLFFILYVIIAINLYFIQIKHAPFFQNLADKQYHVTVQTYPQRGYIVDRNDNPIAINKDCIAAFILPKELSNKVDTTNFIEQHFPAAYQRLDLYKHKNFMFIKRNLSHEEIALIQNANIRMKHNRNTANCNFFDYF